jgi:DNA-directed RNA polymerase specialized sigma24 family protein
MPAFVTPLAPAPGADPRASFVALLPAIEARAWSAFRRLRRYHDREDAVAEVIARAWAAYLAQPACADELAAMAVADVRTQMACPGA